MKASKTRTQQVLVQPLQQEEINVTIIGLSPYVGTNFSDETKKELAAKQAGKTKTKPRKGRDIEGEVYGRRHIENNVDCIPAAAFRAALIDVAKDKSLDGVSGAEIQRCVMAIQAAQKGFDDFIPILNLENDLYGDPKVFESVVKIGRQKTHVAYRPSYPGWRAQFRIIYVSDRLSAQDVLNLLSRAGQMIGVGDTRKIGGGRFQLGTEMNGQ